MMMEVAGGTPSKRKVAGAPPEAKTVITFPLALVEKLAGIKLEEKQIRAILRGAGLRHRWQGRDREGDRSELAPGHARRPPMSSRRSCASSASTRCPRQPMPRSSGVARAVLTETQRRVRRARRTLAGRGLVEAITWSFIPRHVATAFGGGQDALELANPISSEMTSMRPSLLPGLLAAVQRNRNRGFADLGLFEVGQAYRGDAPEDQFIAASAVRAGASALTGSGRHWAGSAPEAGLYDAKADVAGAPRRARLRCRQGADDARGPGLVPSGSLGRTQARPQDHARPLRRAASRDPARARRCRPGCRLRGVHRGAAADAAQGPRASRRSPPPISCPCDATSPSCSMPRLPPAT